MKFPSKSQRLFASARQRIFIVLAILSLVSMVYLQVDLAHAWNSFGEEGAGGTKDSFYRLMRGPFGTLVMVFSGLGGFATIYMKRAGRSQQGVPVVGVVLLLVAVFLFIYRIMITSGLLGAQYLDYGG